MTGRTGRTGTSEDGGPDDLAEPDAEPPLLREVYPDLCAEMEQLLEAEGHRDLAIVAHDLRIIALCGGGPVTQPTRP